MMPYLSILNQPQGNYRFRYPSEMNGTHGYLKAERKEGRKNKHIRVQLLGCQPIEAIIRCTLVTNSPMPVPHVHRLIYDEGQENIPNHGNYQEITVSSENDWTATFSGLTIVHTVKNKVQSVIERRLHFEMGSPPLNHIQIQRLKDEASYIANTMDLHSVKLQFETFVNHNGFRERITQPVYSQTIHNSKCTRTGDLRIVRIDQVSGCCTGKEVIFIFVEKVDKRDIKIRFFETGVKNQETWSAFADFSERDVHRQYAIAFKTPPYHDQNIQNDVTVYFQLYRPSNQSTSEAKSFTYTPRRKLPLTKEINQTSDSNSNKMDVSSPSTIVRQEPNKSYFISYIPPSHGEGSGSTGNSWNDDMFNFDEMMRQQLQMEQHQHWHIPETSLFAVSQPVVHQHQIDYRSGHGGNEMNLDFTLLDEHFDFSEVIEHEDFAFDAPTTDDNNMIMNMKKLEFSKLLNSNKILFELTSESLLISFDSNKSLPFLEPIGCMSTYSFNMTQSVRWQVITGILRNLLRQMDQRLAPFEDHHQQLLLQSDDENDALRETEVRSSPTDPTGAILDAAASNHAKITPLCNSVVKNMPGTSTLSLQRGDNFNPAIDSYDNSYTPLAAIDHSDVDVNNRTSKEPTKELDKNIIDQLAAVFDSPKKNWEKLADSLGVHGTMRSVLQRQTSPTTYLLSNIDLWDITPTLLIENFDRLQFRDAANLLKKYLCS